jgi:hypothetical protein
MALKDILSYIDAEIARLHQVKALLSATDASNITAVRRGRPKKEAQALPAANPARKKKRNMTPDGRARIAEAVKRRWAAQKAKQKKA